VTEGVTLTVPEAEAGERLDALLAARIPDLSRSRAAALIREGHVTVNGEAVKPSYRTLEGDLVQAVVVKQAGLSASPEPIPLTVVYEDADLAVIDKPAGLVVHPAPGHPGGTLANALAARYPSTPSLGAEERPGIVHRLDRDTSGLMVVALSPRGQSSLQEQIASRAASRRYLALVGGRMKPAQGTIDVPIGRDRADRKRMAIHGVAAREARTSYRVVQEFPGFSLLEASLHTGRTHQIRVHLAGVGHAIVGDDTYGGPRFPHLHRQFLHAYRLAFDSPSNGERLEFESALPSDLEGVLGALQATGATSRPG
jgi:23S rRNA pseudouridine1911/1915/1917 synthase